MGCLCAWTKSPFLQALVQAGYNVQHCELWSLPSILFPPLQQKHLLCPFLNKIIFSQIAQLSFHKKAAPEENFTSSSCDSPKSWPDQLFIKTILIPLCWRAVFLTCRRNSSKWERHFIVGLLLHCLFYFGLNKVILKYFGNFIYR